MARRFHGTGGVVDAGATSALDITGQRLTASAWIRPVSTSGARQVVGKWGGTFAWVMGITSANPYFYMNGAVFIGAAGYTATANRWMHLAVVKDGANVIFFADGVQVGITGDVTSINSVAAPLTIGAQNGGAESFDGDIAEVAVWATNLTNSDILQLAQGRKPTVLGYGSQLRGYWPLGISGVEPDLSDYGNQGAVSAGLEATQGPTLMFETLAFGTSLAGTTDLVPGFLNIGVGLFPPDLLSFLNVPFLNVGVGLTAPMLTSDPLPPFVPPPLPPTLVPGTPEGPGVPLPPLSSGGLAGIRFYQGPPWRWVVTDLASSTLTFLDRLAAEAVVTYTLDKGATARLSVPAGNPEVNILANDGEPFVSEGNRLLYGFRREGGGPGGSIWKCRFAGRILLVEDHGLTEDARTTITAYDPWQLMYQRPMVDRFDAFPDKAGFFSFDDTQVGVIALTFLRNTIEQQGELGVDIGDTLFAGMVGTMPGTPYWGGPYTAVWSGRTKSVYENTTQLDTDTQQGLMVGEVFDLMVQSGAVDFLLTPIYDPVRRPGYTHELSIYNRAGVQATDAIFAWDKPSRNLTQINALRDGTKRANTIRYYAETGGPPVGGGIPLADGTSILKYGESWHEEFWPGRIQAAALAMAELQLELMKNGQFTVDVTPSPERAPFVFTEYWLGDTVPVYASNRLRQEIAGFQRIYGVVLQIDENSYEQLPSLLVSPDSA